MATNMKTCILPLLLSFCLTACDELFPNTPDLQIEFVNSLYVGDTWTMPYAVNCDLLESNTLLSKYRVETVKGYYYITVKDGHVVSIWVKNKHY